MQEDKKLPARQLLLDMKVRWSSTYVMLNRAEERREVINSNTSKDIIYKSLFR
jgi:hypothetical protein